MTNDKRLAKETKYLKTFIKTISSEYNLPFEVASKIVTIIHKRGVNFALSQTNHEQRI